VINNHCGFFIIIRGDSSETGCGFKSDAFVKDPELNKNMILDKNKKTDRVSLT